MKSALAALRAELAELRRHIGMMDIESELLAASSASPPCSPSDEIAERFRQHVGLAVAKRRFDYNCIIISLYGAFEHYIESLAQLYVIALNATVPSYAELPQKIIESHVNLTFTVIQKAEGSKYRAGLDAKTLVANLHSCLSNQSQYKVNPVAFSDHAYNFRVESINALFGRLGIEGITTRLRYAPVFAEYLMKRFPEMDVTKPKQQQTDTVLHYLDDLAERRNEVAHGQVQQLLSNPILQEYVDVIEAIGGGLCEILEEEMAKFMYQYGAIELGKPKRVFGHDVICFDVCDKEIAAGDTVIAKTGQHRRPFIAGTILELRSDDVVLHAVPPSAEPVRLGIKIGFKANEKHVYAWVPSPKAQAPATVAESSTPSNAFEEDFDLEAESSLVETTRLETNTVSEQADELEEQE